MNWFKRAPRVPPTDRPTLLEIEGLDVYYGQAHALQTVSLTLDRGVLAVVGRNGMGKTTLCNAVTGLVPASGSIRMSGTELLGLNANAITALGIGYVPQGRRVWPSLSVDEHLRLVAGTGRRGPWTIQRIYETFPRLAERKSNGGAQLSGGEQQMLAIARALLLNPLLLVMDEPTEGLAPVIVQQVADMLKALAREGDLAILLVEQNLGVAIDVADTVVVMVNGRIARSMPVGELAADHELQQRLLGVRSADDMEPAASSAHAGPEDGREDGDAMVYTVRRAGDESVHPALDLGGAPARGVNRWSRTSSAGSVGARDRLAARSAASADAPPEPTAEARRVREEARDARVLEFSVARSVGRVAYVAGTFDTKGRELFFLRNCLERLGISTVTVDLSTSGKPSPASVHPREVARHHPRGEGAVFTGDRGSAVTEMATAFERYVLTRRDLGGLISAGGSGGTALATAAMRRLSIGVPKIMVSTVASGDVKPYVGPSDICMMYSVTDVSGLNRISERVLANAAHALAGMLAYRRDDEDVAKPAVGLTMFGVTTPCVQEAAKLLEGRYDALVFHATGTGGQSMEKLAESGLLSGVIDITTTEVADEIVEGVMSAGSTRLDVFARLRIPYVGSVGALDMVNFWAYETVPERYSGRRLYRHNQNVTLMRTTPEECERIGRWIAEKLNRIDAPVRLLIPEGGISAIDAPGQPFHDPDADRALFSALAEHLHQTRDRRLIRLPCHINDPEFAAALVREFDDATAAADPTVRAGVRA